MQAAECDGEEVIEVRVQCGNEQGVFVAEAQSSAVAFAPNPEGPIDDQGGVEKPTREAHFKGPLRWAWEEAAAARGLGEGEGGFGDGEVGNRRRVEAGLLDASAELAGGAFAPREDLGGGGGVGGCVGGVEDGGFRGGGGGGGVA